MSGYKFKQQQQKMYEKRKDNLCPCPAWISVKHKNIHDHQLENLYENKMGLL